MTEAAVFDYDLAVIGSGGGAFAAAIRATTLGKKVLMVERGTVGGTCVNTGCVPSKALLAAADARHVALDASGRFPGIETSAGPVHMPGLIEGKRSLVDGMRSEKYVDLIADYGWDMRQGEAVFAGTPGTRFWTSFPPGVTGSLSARPTTLLRPDLPRGYRRCRAWRRPAI
ncbi:mercuric reductase [Arthrobacter sp. Hiyo4]|nr:mercuric reductase [Arthrobacter sp. Hiyo4]